MMLQEIIQKAKDAVSSGNLEDAQKYTDQAKALRAIIDLEPKEDAVTVKALRDEIDALKNAPAIKSGGMLVVTEDETDKKSAMPWASLGEQLKAVYVAATQPHRTDERLKAQKAILGANESVPSDGGFLVQPNFSAEIFQIAHEIGQVMPRVRRIPIGGAANGLIMNAIDETSRATGSRWGGVQAYWAAEGDTASATKPKFRQMELKLNKLMAVMYATDELLADTTALGAIAQQAMSEEINWTTENAVFRGSGAGQPLGFVGHASSVSVAKESGQSASTIVVNNIFKMWARMWSRSRANAVWFINQDIEPQLLALDFPVGTGGIPAYLPPGGLSQSPFGTLLGRPIIPVEYASTLGTVGDISLVDLSQYIMIDKGGIQAAESMHVQFLTDQMAYRWVYRVDGQPAWRTALTPANGSATQSPFVTLATRA